MTDQLIQAVAIVGYAAMIPIVYRVMARENRLQRAFDRVPRHQLLAASVLWPVPVALALSYAAGRLVAVATLPLRRRLRPVHQALVAVLAPRFATNSAIIRDAQQSLARAEVVLVTNRAELQVMKTELVDECLRLRGENEELRQRAEAAEAENARLKEAQPT